MKVEIFYCRPCGYRARAEALATELRDRFGAEVQVVRGKLGQFDVIVDGVLVASRAESLLTRVLPPPKAAAIVATIEAHLAMEEGAHCDVPSPGSTPQPRTRESAREDRAGRTSDSPVDPAPEKQRG